MTLRNATREHSLQMNRLRTEPVDALVAIATDGTIATFEELVQSYRHTVLGIGRSILGSTSDAEEIAQQTFMKVFINLITFRKESSFSTWLISIARNEALMWKRKQSRLRESPLILDAKEGDGTLRVIEMPDQRPDPEALCFARECDALLTAKLAQLRPEMREALQFCDLQENSMCEATQFLGVTVAAVKSRRRRARMVLRTKLERHLSCAQPRS